ncbi:MAG TPA: nucleotidyltransferase family protein [Vicinamibacterales bacterium]|nr:nucleotidyltransferase family protein [Vicinamibacterales bacterium]
MVGLVIAAGKGSRYAASAPGAPLKLLTLIDAEPMVRRTVTSLLNGGADRCVVVVSGGAQAVLSEALQGLAVTLTVNPKPARGMFSSIQCGAAHLRAEDWGVLLPGDMPYVRPETVAIVLSAAIRTGLSACATYGDRRGHPLVISTALRDRILQAPTDAKLNEVRSDEDCLSVEVPDPGVHRDVDRPEDL